MSLCSHAIQSLNIFDHAVEICAWINASMTSQYGMCTKYQMISICVSCSIQCNNLISIIIYISRHIWFFLIHLLTPCKRPSIVI